MIGGSMVSGVPKSSLGKCTGSYWLRERNPLIAMACYFDGSASENSQWLTLAGYIASDHFWADFQSVWAEMLQNRYPVPPYIHMADLLSSRNPFERIVGWTDDKISALVRDALLLLSGLDKKLFRSFVCRIDIAAHKRITEEGFHIDDPAVICAECCLGGALLWYGETFGIEDISVFYDQGEPCFGPLKDRWRNENARGKKPNVFWKSIKVMNDLDMRAQPPIQAADILAWGGCMWKTAPQSATILDEKVLRAEHCRPPQKYREVTVK